MLVVDDTRINLLKMKEKLLKITQGDRQALLDEYKELAISIDKDEYNALVDKIRNSNYDSLPLEEQVVFLNDVLDNYNSLNELQYRYRNTYEQYANDMLKLSDINEIYIDNISERSSIIQGYLMNNKNLESNKVELDRLNIELVNALKKQNLIDNKIAQINNNLRTNLLSSEGRILNNNNEMVYTSAKEEYKTIGLNLQELMDNPDIRRETIAKITKEKDDNNETLAAASICFKNNNNDEDIYKKIKEDVRKSEYALVLLEIVNEICSNTSGYDLMLNKLNRLLNLIEERKLYLKTKFYIDPFDRIKIDEQLKILGDVGDNTEEISSIKKTIVYFSDNISSIEDMNREYLREISTNTRLLSENLMPEETKKLTIDNDSFEYISGNTKVIKMSDLNKEFRLDRAIEKTDGVINRVNELFSGNKEETSKVPELLIEPVAEEMVPTETLPVEDIFNEKPLDNNEIFTENTNLYDIFIDEKPKLEENNTNIVNDLFQEVKPFDEAPLFSERSEDIFAPKKKVDKIFDDNLIISNLGNNNKVEEMPDAFWEIKEEPPKEILEAEEENKMSFDEQIDKLINNDNNKIKKRVA